MATSKIGNVVTAKTALTHLAGVRTMLRGQLRTAAQVGADTSQIEKKLDNVDYMEAALRSLGGKSALKSAVGFVSSRF